MKNRFIVIYTVFAAAVFIFSITFFGYNLFNEYNTNQKKSELKFTELVNDIRTLSYAQDENNAAYSQGIKKAVGEASDFSFLQVRRNNETVVLYPTGKSREETVSKLTKSYTSSLNVNKQTITIDCNIYLIRPDSIFYFARISFLMILIITIITIIMIIYLNLSSARSDVVSIEEEDIADTDSVSEADTAKVYNSEVISDTTDNKEDNNSLTEEASECPESPEVHEEISDSFEENNIAEETSEVVVEEERQSEVTPEEVKAIFAEPLTDQQAAEAAEAAKETEPAKLPLDEVMPARDSSNEPAGLFNPDTGIGWESYLLTRLNNEIERATASEIDLSLFIIKLSAVEKGSEVYKNVCNYLSIIFQFKDLLFEYKEDCIVAIKISMNVDEALKMADKLYNDISNLVNNRDTRIGISSRSIRMVGGKRLLLEAEQSIEHSDKSAPVIAFRVDSEKYRKLMETNQ